MAFMCLYCGIVFWLLFTIMVYLGSSDGGLVAL